MLRPDFTDSNHCIPEVRESTSSPSQLPNMCEIGRESLAERPGLEGSIRNPFMMTISTPFSAQSSQRRQIPAISNCRSRGENGLTPSINPSVNTPNIATGQSPDLMSRFMNLKVGSVDS